MTFFRSRSFVLTAGLSALTLLGVNMVACSSDSSGDFNVGNSTGTGSTTSSGGVAVSFGGSTLGFGGGTGTAGGGNTAGNGGNGMPELCDGIDNDANGIIDDLDAGHDGVCDCLNIATLGTIGPWSSGGNVFAAWLNARSPTGATSLGDQVLTPELLKPFQVIVSLHVGTMAVMGRSRNVPPVHAYSDAEAMAFHDWVQNGGGAMSTIGYYSNEAEEVVNVNKLLATVGLGYSATKTQLNGLVNNWTAGHPLTFGISSINTDNGVEPADGGMTLATGSGQRLALKVAESGKGKVIVWGDEWITYDSEWADSGQQVELFWVNILKWLSPINRCQVPIPPDIVR